MNTQTEPTKSSTEKTPSEFEKALRSVINELKAPKGQYNSFGKYKYRNAEDILEAVKPLLFKYDLRLKTSEEIVMVGERYYVKSTVIVRGHGDEDSASAYAREADTKKGMDEAQVTGASGSYAKKYALNDLFDIDDTKDADSQDNRQGKTQKSSTEPRTEEQRQEIARLLKEEGIRTDQIPTTLQNEYGVDPEKPMTYGQAEKVLKELKNGG